jgi:CheY-like chemotaxis protein
VNILVVEDDADTRNAFSALLRARGADVVDVDSAETALRAYHARRPQILICDIGLPHADGNMLLRQIRTIEASQKASEVPAIALTAYVSDQDRRRVFESGFQHHLSKPAEAETLVSIIRRLLDGN